MTADTPLDGLLVIDKPVGPTSHDVVARVRRRLRERRIGHTGTLDPLASGVLLLLIGRATRLARFLNADTKRYVATIHVGVSTDTYDALGKPTSRVDDRPLPSRLEIEAALDRFRGTFQQQPPAFSAKKIAGRRSHRLARSQHDEPPTLPSPVSVTVSRLDVVEVTNHLVTIELVCSSGFYVRSLAHDLGASLGMGAHLAALRRTEAGGHTVDEAISLAVIEGADGPTRARQSLVPMVEVLPDVPRFTLSAGGVRRAVSGCDLGSADFNDRDVQNDSGDLPERVRLLDASKNLVGIADRTAAGLLHPVVVLM